MSFMKLVAQKLQTVFPLSEEELLLALETPANEAFGDVAFPCFILAKKLKRSPQQIAAEFAPLAASDWWSVHAEGPYLNFKMNRPRLMKRWFDEQLSGNGGTPSVGGGKRVIIDMSSPNIAKPFGIGHLRSTMIGHALYRILRKVGYETVSVNHLGDWGTQFGKMIAAHLEWGHEIVAADDPIKAYLALYVKFHEEAKSRPELELQAREWFARLEAGDSQALAYWNQFISDSKTEFQKLYDRLGVHFDYVLGESFYNDKMDAAADELERLGLLEESDGAMVVRLDEEELPPCIIKKSDGASIYATRDLATALYRHDVMKGDQLLYVVGSEQSLHFRQLFLVLDRMGKPWAKQCKHVPFGLMRLNGQKMSTRKGQVVFLEDVLDEAVRHALLKINEKNPNLERKLEVAEAVGIGAVVFGDLKHSRILEVDFNIADTVNFEGETGPYVQYSYARIQSLLRKAARQYGDHSAGEINGTSPSDFTAVSSDYGWQLFKKLIAYPEALRQAAERLEPSLLTRYLIDLAQSFNRFYHHERIMTDNAEDRQAKLKLAKAAGQRLQEGLQLLGVQAPEEI
ncbi:arginine--tRNA ligase [Paenibacillus sp. NEAU-GSW1]|uniref:arginine--tRNA ligase n=1 Tax=Paenibacillus sp. NEAU-GSW1 TaxID=2682486 RepID=UPI0012E1C73A|nr:arginine--tRNA ligase [Paenibacillus sp. NEAU-GSW1]MUT65280.1 arginine--tRNA ligase [Paenibacillus sp. NEAU-GSW1]